MSVTPSYWVYSHAACVSPFPIPRLMKFYVFIVLAQRTPIDDVLSPCCCTVPAIVDLIVIQLIATASVLFSCYSIAYSIADKLFRLQRCL